MTTTNIIDASVLFAAESIYLRIEAAKGESVVYTLYADDGNTLPVRIKEVDRDPARHGKYGPSRVTEIVIGLSDDDLTGAPAT